MARAATILLLIFAWAAVALAQDAPKAEQVSIELKSGEEIPGTLKKVDEDGVTIVGDDKIGLFLRWGLIRGDKHFELRKRAANAGKIDSLLKLADFCHDFAMDKEEGETLKTADALEPGNAEVARRQAILTGKPVPVKPPVTPDKPPVTPDKPPVSGTLKVKIAFDKEDAKALEYLTEKLEERGYVVSAGDYSHVVNVKLTLTVTRNPSFFGGELYALVNGDLSYTLNSHAGAEIKANSFSVKDVRSEAKDAKAQAEKSARQGLIDDLVAEVDKILAPLKK
ncbi:MAG: hypothetical protein IT462_14830 [Planctomycetes bacterium]|nr:hypothetical protein [Planctomycetota bacterium]